jgi:uncharacterized protein (DUF983 family)
MDNRNSGTAGGGITLSGLTFIVFLVLKLCNVIDWSWWWVTAPLWIPFAIGVAILLIIVIVALIGTLIDNRKHKRRRR